MSTSLGAVIPGLAMGAGWILILASFAAPGRVRCAVPRWYVAWAQDVTHAHIAWLTPARLVLVSILVGIAAGCGVYVWTGIAAVAAAIAVVSALVPNSIVKARARQRTAHFGEQWVYFLDALIAGIEAGMSIPEALTQLADAGSHFLKALRAFALSYQVRGNVDAGLDVMRQQLADPVGEGIIDALRIAHKLDGAQLADTLRALRTAAHEDVQLRRTLRARRSWMWGVARLSLMAPWIILIATARQPHAATAWNSASGITVLCLGCLICWCGDILTCRMGRLPAHQVMR